MAKIKFIYFCMIFQKLLLNAKHAEIVLVQGKGGANAWVLKNGTRHQIGWGKKLHDIGRMHADVALMPASFVMQVTYSITISEPSFEKIKIVLLYTVPSR